MIWNQTVTPIQTVTPEYRGTYVSTVTRMCTVEMNKHNKIEHKQTKQNHHLLCWPQSDVFLVNIKQLTT